MESAEAAKNNIDEAQISAAAYQMWDKAGRPSGRDMDFWLEAETQVRARAQADPPSSSTALISNGSKTRRKSSTK